MTVFEGSLLRPALTEVNVTKIQRESSPRRDPESRSYSAPAQH